METRASEIGSFLDQTRDPNPRVRRQAVTHLCPCHVKQNHGPVWDRMLEMAADPDPKVRNWVLHVLTDGSPRERQAEVLAVLTRLHDDPDLKLRRKARKVLAHFRRTGDLNVG
ncbi:MAG TPA: HEAT repeat domain-containing protein [Chloroflexota bacterium]|nr:HEAT repeat domain-containing protein [Chloroflexota bacterium]